MSGYLTINSWEHHIEIQLDIIGYITKAFSVIKHGEAGTNVSKW
jgi:hypothetical protein